MIENLWFWLVAGMLGMYVVLDGFDFGDTDFQLGAYAAALKELTAYARIDGRPVVFGVSDSRFLRGSMGSVVGEKIARAGLRALKEKEPLIIVSASGNLM